MGTIPFTGQHHHHQQLHQLQQVTVSPTGFVGCGDQWTPTATPMVSAHGSSGVDDRVIVTTAFQSGLHAALTAGGLIAATPALPQAAFLPQVCRLRLE